MYYNNIKSWPCRRENSRGVIATELSKKTDELEGLYSIIIHTLQLGRCEHMIRTVSVL